MAQEPFDWPPTHLAAYIGTERFLKKAQRIAKFTDEDAVFDVVAYLADKARNAAEIDFENRFPTEVAFLRYITVAARRRMARLEKRSKQGREIARNKARDEPERSSTIDGLIEEDNLEYFTAILFGRLPGPSLQADEREVLLLRWEGQNFRQIAGSLGVSVGTAHGLWKQALAKLRSFLDAKGLTD